VALGKEEQLSRKMATQELMPIARAISHSPSTTLEGFFLLSPVFIGRVI
jgi:hypothetical protein